MNCYLSRNYRDFSSAGNKAKTDIEQIMEGLSFRNVGLRQSHHSNKIVAFFTTLMGVLKAPFCLHRGDILVLQYPLKKYYSFVCRMAHLRGAKVITLIHDLGSFRRHKLTVEQEINRLNHSDYVIAHNDAMKKWLADQGCKAQLGTLELFDYLSATTAAPAADVKKPFEILYAGALNPRKNTFLYEVGAYAGHAYRFNLYGSGFELDKAQGKENFTYMGFVKSDELIATAKGHFGLVWDGSSVSSCVGDWGEYLQYNNPHKTSLYIRCGLPVIIWSKAALAPFVRKHQIGLCIDSLEELETILSHLTLEQYAEMQARVAEVSNQLKSGYFFTQAVEKAVCVLTREAAL